MLQVERFDKIKDYLLKNEYADIKDLADMLDISTATVRRALKHLEKEQVVDLTRGGAILAKRGSLYEYPYKIKQEINAEEKRRIARDAIQRIGRNESIFLDASTTVCAMTQFMLNLQDITVATNDMNIAQNLINAEYLSVTLIGGTLRRHYYTLTGYFAETTLKDLCFDRAFLGIDAISLRGGLMITNIEEVQIKRKVISSSHEIIVLCDHSKFEQESFLNVCGCEDVNLIITGKELDRKLYKKYTDAGLKIILV
ncbi:MAG: DeoR/GlpR family DNA-binding transcription regulator [Treponema sp.]|jgi:DeoR/GlpR family transcriptional regulator of sugar metabolism|nr:DeoR/GlpR family DNA-binding transcription regulator [Treponema sp.]